MNRNVLGVGLTLLVLWQSALWSLEGKAERFPWFQSSRRVPVFPDLALSPAKLSRALKRGQVIPIDLRSAEAFRKGHIPDAINLYLGAGLEVEETREALAARGVCGDRPVVLYDESSSLVVMGPAFLSLEAAGYSPIKFLLGGYREWIASGEKVEMESSAYLPCVSKPVRRDEVIVDRRWVAEKFDSAEVVLLDVRGPGGWESGSYNPPPAFSAGHIPESLPVDIFALLREGGGWPNPATARAILGRLGPRPGTNIDLSSTVVLVGAGKDDPLPGLGFLLFRALDVHVKVYAGGLQDWREDQASPIVRIPSTADVKVALSEAQDEASRPVVFDLREEWDFRDGHLPGADSLPSHRFAAEFETRLREKLPAIERSQVTLIFYCYGLECIRSRECATTAARHGFLNLLWYREGFDTWSREGGIVEVGDFSATRGSRPSILTP